MNSVDNILDSSMTVRIIRNLGDGLSRIWSNTDYASPLDNALQIILGELLSLFPSEEKASAAIYTYEQGKFRNRSADGPLKEYLLKHLPRPDGTMMYAIKVQRPLFVNNVDADEMPNEIPGLSIQAFQAGVKSLANIPLIVSSQGMNTVVGVLIVNFTHPFEFNLRMGEVLRVFAELAATAIDNAQLHQKYLITQQRLFNEKENLRRKSEHLGRIANLDMVVNEIIVQLEKTPVLRKFFEGELYNISIQLLENNYRIQIGGKGFSDPRLPEWANKPVDEDPLIGPILISQLPRIVEDITGDPILNEGSLQSIGTWVAIPMLYGDKPTGLIIIDSIVPKALPNTDEVLEMLSAFGEYAARAIVSYQVKDLAATRQRELEVINSITKEINAEIETKRILHLIVKTITRELHCKACTYFEPKSESTGSQGIVLESVESWDDEELGRKIERKFRLDENSLVVTSYKSNKILRFRNARLESEFAPTKEWSAKPLSMLLVPVISGDHVIGVISADHNSLGWFTEQDERFVKTLADQAGASLFRARRLETLRDLSSKIVSTQTITETLITIVKSAVKLTEADNCVLFLIDPMTLNIRHTVQYPSDFQHPKPRISEKRGLTYWIVNTQLPRVIPELEKETEINEEIMKLFRSSVGVPLIVREQVYGVMWANSREIDYFSPRDVSVLSTLANYASVGIENAQKYELLNTELTRRIKDFNEAGQVVMRAALIGELTHKVGSLAGLIPLNVELAQEQLDSHMFGQKDVVDCLSRIHWASRQILQQIQELDRHEAENDVAVEQLVYELIEETKNRTPATFVIQSHIESGIPNLRCIRTYLRRALSNIIDNALDAMPTGGSLILAARKVTDNNRPAVIIEITDTGGGIPEAIRHRIYDLFFTTKMKIRHMGFGLWYTKLAIENLGGSVSYDTGPSGTKFRLVIPYK